MLPIKASTKIWRLQYKKRHKRKNILKYFFHSCGKLFCPNRLQMCPCFFFIFLAAYVETSNTGMALRPTNFYFLIPKPNCQLLGFTWIFSWLKKNHCYKTRRLQNYMKQTQNKWGFEYLFPTFAHHVLLKEIFKLTLSRFFQIQSPTA